MTNEEYDELDAMTNPEMVKKAMVENQRGKNRPVFLDIICDIRPVEVVKYDGDDGNGGTREKVSLELTNIRVNRCKAGEVFTDTDYTLEMNWPKQPNDNVEVALMVASAAKVDPKVNSIRKFPGLKNVHLVEEAHPWTIQVKRMDEFNEPVLDDKGKQVYDKQQLTTYYYAVKGIGGKASVNQPDSKPKEVVKATEEQIAVAITLIESEADGISDSDFNKAAMKNEVLKGNVDALMNGSLIADVIATGKIVRDGELLKASS